ncbi:MAG: archaemetzincin [Planctomycetia bacterium]|nr:archaemetzincin [Planctomycetia bacterium]
MRIKIVLGILACWGMVGWCVGEDLPRICANVVPLYEPFPELQPGDWQYEHREPGQTYTQYRKSLPTVATRQREVLYVQVLGKMKETDQEIVRRTVEYLEIFYGLQVKRLPAMSLSKVPATARRIHPDTGQRQLQAIFIAQKIMYPRLPKDAAAYILLTAEDLWPGEGGNFCFGYAMYQARVGIWSMARHGDSSNEAEREQCLRRTLRVASHETGHMFSLKHCTKYRCGMNGANSLEEADETPLEFCPECLAKLRWACKRKLLPRWEELENFYDQYDLRPEADFVRRCLEMVEPEP